MQILKPTLLMLGPTKKIKIALNIDGAVDGVTSFLVYAFTFCIHTLLAYGRTHRSVVHRTEVIN